MSQNPVPYTGAGAKKGWYLHLPETGERLLKTINFYDASNNLEVLTQIPASGGNAIEETCTPSPQEERQFRTFLNIMDGRRPGVQVMDSNGDGLFNALDQQVSRMQTSKGAQSPVMFVLASPLLLSLYPHPLLHQSSVSHGSNFSHVFQRI